jgi:hypothetical protein
MIVLLTDEQKKTLSPEPPRRQVFGWVSTVIWCLILGWTYLLFPKGIDTFRTLYEGLGVELPLATRLLFVTYPWLFPILFVGLVGLAVVKQLIPLDKRRTRIINLTLVGAVLAPGVVVLILYLPLFVLIHKLHSAK